MPLEDVSRQLEGAIEALAALQTTLRELRAEIGGTQRRVAAPIALDRLQQIVEQVGQDRPARPLVCPDDYIRQWNLFVAGRGAAPGARGIRYLCWEPDIANSPGFRRLLIESGFDLRARSIQGLVRSCHLRWDRLAKEAVEFARNCLRGYRGPNRVLKSWRDHEELIFDHAPFARDMLTTQRTPQEQAVQWSVSPQSDFLLSAMEVATEAIRAPRSRATPEDVRNILFWDGWELGRFKTEIGRTLLLPDLEQRPVYRELVGAILSDSRLRDPRLPANAKNWVKVPPEARERLIRLLAAADIQFFFEHVLPRGHDPHGRKPFWMSYLHQVRRSRPLLSQDDYARLRRMETQMRSRMGSFGRVTHATTSAFLLDFGSVLVIEFSEPGNACYCYAKPTSSQVVPEFWDDTPFNFWGLKQKNLVGSLNADNVGDRSLNRGFRFTHAGPWQEKASRQLAMMGIRPR